MQPPASPARLTARQEVAELGRLQDACTASFRAARFVLETGTTAETVKRVAALRRAVERLSAFEEHSMQELLLPPAPGHTQLHAYFLREYVSPLAAAIGADGPRPFLLRQLRAAEQWLRVHQKTEDAALRRALEALAARAD